VFTYFNSFYLQDAAKQQTASIKFTHRPKISIFAPPPAGATHSTDSCEIWHSQGARQSICCARFHANQCTLHRGGNSAQKWQKFPLFGKQLLHGGEPFDLFVQLLLYAQPSCISISHLMRFAPLFTELLLRNHALVIYPIFFRVTCRNNYALNQKNDWHLF